MSASFMDFKHCQKHASVQSPRKTGTGSKRGGTRRTGLLGLSALKTALAYHATSRQTMGKAEEEILWTNNV